MIPVARKGKTMSNRFAILCDEEGIILDFFDPDAVRNIPPAQPPKPVKNNTGMLTLAVSLGLFLWLGIAASAREFIRGNTGGASLILGVILVLFGCICIPGTGREN
jgi:hypothetical protein